MLPEIRHLRAFCAVAEDLSFRGAAERIGVAQSALSRTIKQLEEIVTVPLFERSTRKVGLTEAGKAFFIKAQRMLGDIDDAVRLAQRVHYGIAGQLRVGFNDFAISGLLPEIVRRFRTLWPEIEVSLVDASSPQMIDMVLDGKLEVAFHAASAEHEDLESLVVRDERLLCILPASHSLAESDLISVSDLAGEPFIMGRRDNWSIFHRKIRHFCKGYGFEPEIVQEAEHSDGIIGFVAAEMGVTLYVDTESLHHMKSIIAKPLQQKPPDIQTLATWRRKRRMNNTAIDQFLQVTKEVVDENGVVLNSPLNSQA